MIGVPVGGWCLTFAGMFHYTPSTSRWLPPAGFCFGDTPLQPNMDRALPSGPFAAVEEKCDDEAL